MIVARASNMSSQLAVKSASKRFASSNICARVASLHTAGIGVKSCAALTQSRLSRDQIVLHTKCTTQVRPFATSLPRQQTQVKPYLLADVGEGITECEIIKWFVQPGAVVQEFDPICEVQSDKASVEITSRYAGRVLNLMHKEGDVAKVGQPLCEIEVEVEGDSASEETTVAAVSLDSPIPVIETQGSLPLSDNQVLQTKANAGREILAIPAVRRISKEHNVNLADVVGTGKGGRITKEDILKFVQNGGKSVASSSSSSAATTTTANPPSSPQSAEVEVLSLDPVRRAMFRAMTSTLQVPRFGYSDEIDVTELENIRNLLSNAIPAKYRKTPAKNSTDAVEQVETEGRFDKLTMLPLLVKTMSLALYEHPLFRSTLSLPDASVHGGDLQKIASQAKLHRRSSHDISIALSSSAGLLTPCLSNIQVNSVFDVASSIVQLQNRASSPKGLGPKDLKATGTITLSNIGAVGGGTYTHPLLPPTGQLAIGALGRTRALPRFVSEIPSLAKTNHQDPNAIARRLIMPASFTGDHRVLEGAELAKLVNRWKQLIENPALWLGVMH